MRSGAASRRNLTFPVHMATLAKARTLFPDDNVGGVINMVTAQVCLACSGRSQALDQGFGIPHESLDDVPDESLDDVPALFLSG